MSTLDFHGSPYYLDDLEDSEVARAETLRRNVELLRARGALTEQTLRAYFGDKRFEQIAESNAIEGSTLSVGETQLAVLRGVTITGHDPAYTADAINLSRALDRLQELARLSQPTDIAQIKEIHELILGDSPGAGLFRTDAVRIGGAAHVPPSTWQEIMAGMEDLESWSNSNRELSPILRAIVLHAWLTHLHPFTDGNGRTSRAVMNLELIRAGLPSIIIRKKDRLRYYEALAESDAGGDLGLLAGLILDRAQDALRDLERAAAAGEGYDKSNAQLRKAQERQVAIWNDAVRLLFSLIAEDLVSRVGDLGNVETYWYEDELLLDDYVSLSQGDPTGNSWLFKIDVRIPGLGERQYLAWTGYRSSELRELHELGHGPAIFWSVPGGPGEKRWVKREAMSPGVAEMSLSLPNVDKWLVRLPDGRLQRMAPSAVARRISKAVVRTLGASVAPT